jgi:hypothetical protein
MAVPADSGNALVVAKTVVFQELKALFRQLPQFRHIPASG